MVNVKKINFFLLLLAAFLLINPVSDCQADTPRIVRVAVFRQIKKVRLDAPSAFSVKIVDDNSIVMEGDKANNILIQNVKSGFDIEAKEIKARRIDISRLDSGPISVNGRLFRGTLRFIKEDASSFLVVNLLDLEDYIRGVLYHEISHLWPAEAIKSQAVVVRTFALSQIKDGRDKEFDLTNDVYSQVYGGRTSERFRLNEAVDSTKSEVFTFGGKIFPAYYHATCAGQTEDAKYLWNIELPPLKGVICGYCRNSPHYKWDTYIELDNLREKLRSAGFKIGKIDNIEILKRDNSKRIAELDIISGAKSFKISGKSFREAVGPNILRSNNYEVKVEADRVFFDGFGWGHGVGFCQWGAYFMGKRGFDYKQILEFYYPGAKLEKIY